MYFKKIYKNDDITFSISRLNYRKCLILMPMVNRTELRVSYIMYFENT